MWTLLIIKKCFTGADILHDDACDIWLLCNVMIQTISLISTSFYLDHLWNWDFVVGCIQTSVEDVLVWSQAATVVIRCSVLLESVLNNLPWEACNLHGSGGTHTQVKYFIHFSWLNTYSLVWSFWADSCVLALQDNFDDIQA